MEIRLDKLLLDKAYVTSRERAKSLILKSAVRVNGQIIDKPGKLIPVDAVIELLQEDIPWVSRGALKLAEALESFQVQVNNKVCIDVGASTGGFTQVLLSKGAEWVYAVDVGQGQLVELLRSDPRVINLEKTHVKELNKELIPRPPELCVIDVSFISLEKVLPFLPDILASNAEIIALIKPQFEVGKANLNNKGIVKSTVLYPEVIQKIEQVAKQIGFKKVGIIDSPILGGDGNKEFLIYLKREAI